MYVHKLPYFLPFVTDYPLIIGASLRTQRGTIIRENQVFIISRFRHRRGIFLRSNYHSYFGIGTLTPRICDFERERIVTHDHVGYMKYGTCTALLK